MWYSIAVAASLFLLLFVFAALSAYPTLPPHLWFPSGLTIWLALLAAATWRLARSPTVQNASVSLAPIYGLQALLIFFTVARMPFEAPAERDMMGAMVLVWETWTIIFSFSFLLLATCGRRRIPLRTWLTTTASAVIVGWSIAQRL